jgi:hypothetical protein
VEEYHKENVAKLKDLGYFYEEQIEVETIPTQSKKTLTEKTKEFEALRVQDLNAFDALQQTKLDIFKNLTALTGVDTEHSQIDDDAWICFKDLMSACRDMHRRNEILIIRKLDAIRGTLQTLNGTDSTASVEVYDRLGRMARGRGGRGVEIA